MKEKILEVLKAMDDDEIVSIWNEYCYDSSRYDDEILDYDQMNETISNSSEDAMFWVNRFYFGSDDYGDGSANPNRNYFKFNGYGNIVSFDYIYNSYTGDFNHIDVDDLIDEMIDTHNSYYNNDIEEILEECEDVA